MDTDRIPIYGHDAEGNKKRGLDCILEHGKLYLESVNKQGNKVKTPAGLVTKALKQLLQNQQLSR